MGEPFLKAFRTLIYAENADFFFPISETSVFLRPELNSGLIMFYF
jgi:hypothetical protein